MKTAAILMLIAAGLWVTGFLFASLAEDHAEILFYLCIFTGLLLAAVSALIFLYRLTKFLITRDPRSLQ